MQVRFPLWCPQCDRHAHYVLGLNCCDCGGAYDPGLPPVAAGSAPGPGIWKFRAALGSLPREISLGEGSTPLLPASLGRQEVLLKLEHLSPTGSYKDRGAAYCLSLLASLGMKSVTEDSSGNAGAAYAAYAAALGMECEVFVPGGAPAEKIEAIRRYGARVHEIPEGREAAHDRARGLPSYAGHAWAAPFLIGVGTLAWEILEQTGGTPPGEVILPVGQGGLLYATYLAFRWLHRRGRIPSMPILSAVQAEACAPLSEAARAGGGRLPEIARRETAADAVAVRAPVRWRQVLRAVQETGGEWHTVSEDEIGEARKSLAALGHDVEPASALPWAVLRRRVRSGVELHPCTIAPLTGSGWKSRGPEGRKTP